MKKKQLKTIRQIANQLPEMEYSAYPIKGVIEPQKKKEQIPVNHYRRLKRAVNKLGFEKGVKTYCDAVSHATGKEIKLMVKSEG